MNIGKQEGRGVPKTKGGSWDSRAQIIQKKGRFGNQEVIDVKGDAFSRTLGVFHSAQPTFRSVNPEFGEVAAEKIVVESKSQRFDADGGSVLDSADLEFSDAAPTGGGEGGGEIRSKEKKMEGDRGKGQKEEQKRS